MVAAAEFDALCLAAAGLVAATDDEGRVVERAGLVGGVEPQAGAEEPVRALLQAHATVGIDAVELLVQLDAFTENARVVLAEFRLSGRRDLDIHHAFDAPRVDIGRALGCRGQPRRQPQALRKRGTGKRGAPSGKTGSE